MPFWWLYQFQYSTDDNKTKYFVAPTLRWWEGSLMNMLSDEQVRSKVCKGGYPKKTITVLVKMVLSPWTSLPSRHIGNKKIVKVGTFFNPPTYYCYRE